MPLVSYVFQNDFAANKAGDVVSLEPEQAEALVAAGVLAEATADDVNGPADDEVVDEAPEQEAALTRAIADGFAKLESSLVRTAKSAVSSKPVALGNFAAPKQPVFKSLGDMMRAQYRAKQGDQTAYNKLNAYHSELRRKSPAGMATSPAADGGYAVIPEWSDEIFSKVKNWPKLLDMTSRVTISGNTFNMPAIDETSLADGSRGGGIRAYWVAEADAITTSYPAMTQVQSVLNLQAVMVPVTNQLLEDNAYNLDSFLAEKVGEEFVWQEDKSVISGSGSSQPTGILNQASLVTVTKEGSQTATTINYQNLKKMYTRLWPGSRANAVWLVEPQVYSQLIDMTFPNASGSYPAFGGVTYNASDDKFPVRIFGKPVIECQMSPALGTVGDILLADLKQLTTAEHPGMQVAVSDQVYFTSLQTLFRFVRRYDIKSPWTSAVTSNSVTYSPFVALQTRS